MKRKEKLKRHRTENSFKIQVRENERERERANIKHPKTMKKRGEIGKKNQTDDWPINRMSEHLRLKFTLHLLNFTGGNREKKKRKPQIVLYFFLYVSSQEDNREKGKHCVVEGKR